MQITRELKGINADNQGTNEFNAKNELIQMIPA